MRPLFRISICLLAALFVLVGLRPGRAATPREPALQAARRATTFLVEQVASHGGYVWRYSDDLALREGEGVVDETTLWIQPPGTPAVGEAFVRLFEATGDPLFRDAALAAADALRLGQMRSGGWQASIEFEPERRQKWAYRFEKPAPKQKDQSSLDDDKTQSAIRFLIRLDRALGFEHAAVHDTVTYALDGLLENGQFANGGFPQVWSSNSADATDPGTPARYPTEWSREYLGHQEYWSQPTLNDNLMTDVIATLFLAADAYDEPRYRDAALRAADFLLRAQMPEPQPAWAQQYNAKLQPIWARRFEPPAIAGGESQAVIATLLEVSLRTADQRYLAPIPRALDYLEASLLPNGRLARFYELETNTPLFFTRSYELTYDDSDLPTHYSFTVSSRLPKLRRDYDALCQFSPDERIAAAARASDFRAPVKKVSEKVVRTIIDAMDDRGAWVTNDGLRYHKQPGPVIDMRVAASHLTTLAAFLSASHAAE